MTGNATSYDDASALDLVVALDLAFTSYHDGRGRMTITADIEWAGDYNPRPHRTTTLFSAQALHLAGVREATAAAMAALDAHERAIGARRPKSVPAQVRALSQARWQAAGLTVTPKTVARWLAGTQQPSKINRAKLQRATDEHYQLRVNRTAATVQTTARAAADALSTAIRDICGSEVRFFNVSDLEFDA